MLVAVVALVVLVGAGAVIFQKLRALAREKELAGMAAAAPGAAAPVASAPQPEAEARKDEEASWAHTALAVVHGSRQGDGRPVIVIGRPTGVTRLGQLAGIQKGLLSREIVRQAVLLAARDELGLPTRDEVLGDAPPGGQGSVTADVATLLRVNGAGSVRMGRADGGKMAFLMERDFLPAAPVHDVVEIAAAAERLSRTEFPRALRALGLDGKPNAVRSHGEIPGPVENQLAGLGFVEPLVALRALHTAIRNDGESPAQLGALVRGYARLGVLNEQLWSPAHKVFKARALLYAQRLIIRDPKSPWGLWHRAYALALAGLHKKAIEDMAEADKLAQASGGLAAPSWVDTLKAYCHFDLARLKNVAGPEQRFAALLRMLAFEFPHHGDSPLHCAQELLKLDPECFRAHDVMYKAGGVANLHVATVLAPQVLTQIVPKRIRSIDALPESVCVPIDRSAGEVALADALERAGRPEEDAGEPSWAVLGSLIRETRFVQVQHRLYFMRYWWSVPVEEFWDEARPLVARHRYQPYLLTLALGTPQADRAFAESFDEGLLPDLEFTERLMTSRLEKLDRQKYTAAWKLTQQHMDHLVKDFATQCDIYTKDHKEVWIHNANKILGLSPENPYAMSLLVEVDWENIQPQLAEWEKKGTEFLPLAGALARRYSELRQYEKARALLERCISELPEHWAFERLAANFKEQGDTAHWLATLDRYLASGYDHGLEPAQVRVEIANYHMANGDWKKAQPYAEAAAATWAGWAMQCAVRCYVGLNDWKRAELWVQRLSERYPNTAVQEWLEFCKRTGHGDRAAAQALVDQYRAAVGDPGNAAAGAGNELDDPLKAGLSAWLKGDTNDATLNLRKAYESDSPLVAGIALVAMADERGDSQQRDRALNDLFTKHRSKAPLMFQVLQIFRDSFARPNPAALDLAAIDRAVSNVKPNARGNTEFAVGWLLKKHGKRQDAETYLKRCIQTATTNGDLKRIAESELRRGSGSAAAPAASGQPISR